MNSNYKLSTPLNTFKLFFKLFKINRTVLNPILTQDQDMSFVSHAHVCPFLTNFIINLESGHFCHFIFFFTPNDPRDDTN